MRVGFIGLGKLGFPVAEVMAEHYYLEGYDIQPKKETNFKVVDNLSSVVSGKDLIFIAVQTPHEQEYDGSSPLKDLPNRDFDYSLVEQILTDINPLLNKNQLVVLISTTLPGTVRERFIPLLKNARFIYNPYLIAMGTVKEDLVNPEMVIIGTQDGDLTGDAKLLIDFYDKFIIKSTRYEVGTWDEAEAIKIFYNTFISAKLSLVNMIQDVAVKSGNINVDVVTGALAKSDYRITGPAYMTAGLGDGGPCHPRDNIALRYLAEKLNLGYDLFDAIIHSREIQAKNIADFLLEFNLPIVIYGITYKSFVPYTDGSYSLLINSFLKEQNVVADIIDFNLNIDHKITKPSVIFISYHDDNFDKIEIPKGSIIVDPWRKLNMDGTYPVIHYGNSR